MERKGEIEQSRASEWLSYSTPNASEKGADTSILGSRILFLFIFPLFFILLFSFFLFLSVYFSIPRAVSASSRSLFARSSARGKVSIAHTRNSRPRSHSPSRTPLVTPIDTCKQTIVKNRASPHPGLFSISAPTTRLLLPVTSLRFCDLHPHPLWVYLRSIRDHYTLLSLTAPPLSTVYAMPSIF